MFIVSAARRGLQYFGIDVVRKSASPMRSLLGLTRFPIRTVIDVGANEGQFARIALRCMPQARIHCFEPLSAPYSKLQVWAEQQEGRVRCHQIALGDSEGTATMNVHTAHSASSSLLATTDNCETLYPQTVTQEQISVRLTTMDAALAESGGLESEVLIKLDVQGFEDRVLRGAPATLAKARAVILEVGFDPLYKGQADFHTLAQLLREHGLSYAGNLEQVYAKDGHVIYFDAVFVRNH